VGLPRVAPKGGIQIGDQHFPEGVTLTVSPAVTHLSKSLWGPDAQEFRPERWFEPDAAAKERYFIPVSRFFPRSPRPEYSVTRGLR
jgi:cytochrome P450